MNYWYVTNQIVIVDLTNNQRFTKSKFATRYKFYNENNYWNFSLLGINNSPDKYKCIEDLYLKIKKNIKNKMHDYYLYQLKDNLSYEEFEYETELFLEEFKLYLDKFEFDNIKKII